MSFQGLASPAPNVERAEAPPAVASDEVSVEPAKDSGSFHTDPAPHSGPAVPFDSKFAPKITVKDASSLSVQALRGRGTDFESEAGVIKGGVQKMFLRKYLPWFFDYRDYISYGEESDTRPLYAVQIETVIAMVEDPARPDSYSYTVCPQVDTNRTGSHLVTVLLRDRKARKLAYQITFDTEKDKSVVKRFMDVLAVNAKHYGGEVITASVVNAQNVAKLTPQKAKR
ncbi:MAG: hypothetical protein SGARI_006550 [Bacillariaceae sp.]